MHRPPAELQPLVQLVHAKPAATRFYWGIFETLYTEKLLNFDLLQQRWRWDTDAIDAKGITDNVVDPHAGQNMQLPDDTWG